MPIVIVIVTVVAATLVAHVTHSVVDGTLVFLTAALVVTAAAAVARLTDHRRAENAQS